MTSQNPQTLYPHRLSASLAMLRTQNGLRPGRAIGQFAPCPDHLSPDRPISECTFELVRQSYAPVSIKFAHCGSNAYHSSSLKNKMKNMSDKLFDTELMGRDKAYDNICVPENDILKQAHNLCEEMWADYSGLADDHFKTEISINFYQRFWEMDLTYTLRNGGINVACPKPGPDILVDPDGERIWFEAISPEPGDGPDAVPEVKTGIASSVPSEEVKLRLTAAVKDKHDKYQGYLDAGIVNHDEPFVIAINAAQIYYARVELSLPWVIQTVFPIGDQYVSFDRQTGEAVDSGFHFKDRLKKSTGAEVPTDYFLNPEFDGISAVLYSSSDCCNRPDERGKDYVLVHNPMARNPIPERLFNFGREYVATVNDDNFELRVV